MNIEPDEDEVVLVLRFETPVTEEDIRERAESLV